MALYPDFSQAGYSVIRILTLYSAFSQVTYSAEGVSRSQNHPHLTNSHIHRLPLILSRLQDEYDDAEKEHDEAGP